MSSIERGDAFGHLVGLIKHLNDNMHKWLALHLSLQTALIVALSTLQQWASQQGGQLHFTIVIAIGLFGILISVLIGIILHRNRSYFSRYIERAINVEGENPYIWESNFVVSGPGLKATLGVVHGAVIIGWILFMSYLACGS